MAAQGEARPQPPASAAAPPERTAPLRPEPERREKRKALGFQGAPRRPPQPGSRAGGFKRGGHHVGPNDSGKRARRKTAQGEVRVAVPDATGDAGASVLTATGRVPGARPKSRANPPLVGARAKSRANPPLVGARAKSRANPPLVGARAKSRANPPLVGARAKSKASPKYDKKDRRRKQRGAAD